mmetsp:Transcript_49497/g.105826  ORF Transcript_49497/g.105826 Transcript_49497/m.105826 type:complete len:888 (+) Transcript_49497:61-2724(+)
MRCGILLLTAALLLLLPSGGTGGSCGPEQWQSSAVVTTCAAASGSAGVQLQFGQITRVLSLPTGVANVSVTLDANVDLDIQLIDDDTGTCVVGFGCTYSSQCTDVSDFCIAYASMPIYFSGDDSVSPVSETVVISGPLTRSMTVQVKSYAAVTGTVTYSHSALSVCPELLPGCSFCSSYAGCGAAEAPMCDGSSEVACVTATSTATSTTTPATCSSSQWQPSPVVMNCGGGSGSLPVQLQKGQTTNIWSLPIGASNVFFQMTANADLDIKLFDDDSNTCIVGFGCTYASSCSSADYCIAYEDMSIYFSGDDMWQPISETIAISGALTRRMTLKVKSYAAEAGAFSFSYGPASSCPDVLPGCSQCSSYAGCTSSERPACDGSSAVICIQINSAITSIIPASIEAGVATQIALEGRVAAGDLMVWATNCSAATPHLDPSGVINVTLAAGTYKLCYQMDGSSRPVEQLGITLRVGTLEATRISGISPSTIIADVATLIALQGTVGAGDLMVWAASCSSAVPHQDPSTTATVALTAGSYKLCYQMSGASHSVEQLGIILTVVIDTTRIISGISPAIISAGVATPISLHGIVAAGDMLAWSANCTAATPSIDPIDGIDPVMSLTIAAGTYKLCYQPSDANEPMEQVGITLRVIATTITSTVTALTTTATTTTNATGPPPPLGGSDGGRGTGVLMSGISVVIVIIIAALGAVVPFLTFCAWRHRKLRKLRKQDSGFADHDKGTDESASGFGNNPLALGVLGSGQGGLGHSVVQPLPSPSAAMASSHREVFGFDWNTDLVGDDSDSAEVMVLDTVDQRGVMWDAGPSMPWEKELVVERDGAGPVVSAAAAVEPASAFPQHRPEGTPQKLAPASLVSDKELGEEDEETEGTLYPL